MATSRKTARDTLKGYLDIYLAGLVKTVTSHKLTDIKGKFPIAYVQSAGTDRIPTTFIGSFPDFHFNIVIYIQRKGWTDAEACDALDAIEAKVAEMCETETTPNQCIRYTDVTGITEIDVDGSDYYRESISVAFKIGVS